MIWLSVLLAVVSACCQTVAARWQHRAVRATRQSGLLTGRAFVRAVGNRWWLLGALMAACGAGLHITALGLAPLVVVQPIGILALVLAALPSRRNLPVILLTTVSVTLFVVLAATGSTDTPPISSDTVLDVVRASTVLVAVLLMAGLVARGRFRCTLFAAGAAVLYGTVSALIRAVIEHAERYGVDLLTVLYVAAIGTALLLGAWLVSQAHANGPPAGVLATLTTVDPVVAAGIGVIAYHEAGAVGVVQVVCAVVALTGAAVLTRRLPDQTVEPQRERVLESV